MRLIIVTIFMANFSFALADDCSPVENSSRFANVRNQENSEWCYAFAAADLLGEKIGIKFPNQISAYDMALAYNSVDANDVEKQLPSMRLTDATHQESIKNETLAGARALQAHNETDQSGKYLDERGFGFVANAVNTYNFSGGYCLESQLPSQPDGLSLIRPGPTEANGLNPFLPTRSDSFIPQQTRLLEGEGGFSSCREGINTSNVHDLNQVKKIIADYAVKAVTKAANLHCDPRQRFPPTVAYESVVNEPSVSTDLVFANLTTNLTEQRSIGVSFDKCAITKGPHPASADCRHAAIAIGRQKAANGVCEYEIRNSWGHDCGMYVESISKTCDPVKGTFWIDEKQLKSIFNGVSLIP